MVESLCYVCLFLCVLCVLAVQYSRFGGNAPYSCRAMAKFAQQRIALVFPPFLRDNGGGSRACCHPKVATRWLSSCFPPFRSATILQISPQIFSLYSVFCLVFAFTHYSAVMLDGMESKRLDVKEIRRVEETLEIGTKGVGGEFG